MRTKEKQRRNTRSRGLSKGTVDKPRICVFRSNKNIYAQVINDGEGKVLASESSVATEFKGSKSKIALEVGENIGEKLKSLKIESAIFDRNGKKLAENIPSMNLYIKMEDYLDDKGAIKAEMLENTANTLGGMLGDMWKKTFAGGEYGRGSDTESYRNSVGRFPANTILTYDETDFDEVCGGFPDTKGGKRHNTAIRKSDKNSGYGFDLNTRNEFNDSGSASRYFYAAKASKKDRDEGLNIEIEEYVLKENTPKEIEQLILNSLTS